LSRPASAAALPGAVAASVSLAGFAKPASETLAAAGAVTDFLPGVHGPDARRRAGAGAAQLGANGQAVFSFALGAGAHSLTVSDDGDGNFQPGASDPLAVSGVY
jgi:hypothetical protein